MRDLIIFDEIDPQWGPEGDPGRPLFPDPPHHIFVFFHRGRLHRSAMPLKEYKVCREFFKNPFSPTFEEFEFLSCIYPELYKKWWGMK